MTELDPDSTSLIYAGIGSRQTPRDVLDDMTTMSSWLARTGWHLASGGAHGADTAFANGAPSSQRTIYTPWTDYNGLTGPDCITPDRAQLEACMTLAGRLHPTWDRCSQGARRLHGRNAAILLGTSLDRPVNAVVAWTPGGAIKGGTGMGLRIAAEYDIPVLNLGSISPREACEQLQAIREAHQQASIDRTAAHIDTQAGLAASEAQNLRFTQGDIFEQPAEAIVNPVNCVGVMGRGLALEFKNRYPDAFAAYRDACADNRLQPGRVFLYETGQERPRWIVHFPTKRHWRDRSLISDIEAGLRDLAKTIDRHKIKSIAIPPIGSGLGGLDWQTVRPLLAAHLAATPATVSVLEPGPLSRSRTVGQQTTGDAETHSALAEKNATTKTRREAASLDAGRSPAAKARAPRIFNLKHHPDAVKNGAIRIDRQTEWGNPFRIGEHGSREEVIALYTKHLWKRISSGAIPLTALAELNGKDLACWCSPPAQACHGQVLARAATWAASRLAVKAAEAVPSAQIDPSADHEKQARTTAHDTQAARANHVDASSKTYAKADACPFRFTRDTWGLFSNFAPLPAAIAAGPRSFATSEHLYQAAKFGESPDSQRRIAYASTAREAAGLGRRLQDGLDPDWNDQRIDVMRWVIRMKREANPAAIDALLERTGERPIVEVSSRDRFWGANPAGDTYQGANVLGRLWMELRQQMREADPAVQAAAWAPSIRVGELADPSLIPSHRQTAEPSRAPALSASSEPSSAPTQTHDPAGLKASESLPYFLQTFMDNHEAHNQQAHAANIDRVLLPGFEQHAEAALELADHANSDDIPQHVRSSLSIVLKDRERYDHAIVATDDICKRLDASVERHHHLEHLARIEDVEISKVESYNQWLSDARKLSTLGDNIIQQLKAYDCGFTPDKWQEFSKGLFALDTAIGENTFFLRHSQLYLEPLPHSPSGSEETLQAHALYRQVRDAWHEHIAIGEKDDPHPYEDAPSRIVNAMHDLSQNTHLPDRAQRAISSLHNDCTSYRNSCSEVETYLQDTQRSLDSNRGFAKAIQKLNPQKVRAEDIEGYGEWQDQAAKLVHTGEEMMSKDSATSVLYLKHNPDLENKLKTNIGSLKNTLEDALPSRTQEFAQHQQVDQHRSISRGMRM